MYAANLKDGSNTYSFGTAPTGYKLLNPEILQDNFLMKDNMGVVNGKDVDITLHYAPISPILIYYVDEDSGEVLSTSSVGANTSSTASQAYLAGDPTAIGPSKFRAAAIDIPGYVLDGNEYQIENYTNVQSKGNLNYQKVTFKYKKIMDNQNPKDSQKGSGAQYGEYFGPEWSTIDPADVFQVSGVQGMKYQNEQNGDVEARMDAVINKYKNQGYTYVGTFNYHQNDDYYNWNEASTALNLVPNKPVTVQFIDEQGNKLAANETIAFNHDNPDQTNNGINPDKHFYSKGEWKATPKEFAGYTLRTTYGATNGQFTPYAYVVTFEYAKQANAEVKYIDDTTGDQLHADNLDGFVGDKIDYSTANRIANYENDGYVLVSDSFGKDGQTYQDGSNVFEVHLKHGTQPITPMKPGNFAVTDLQSDVTRTINYVNEQGEKVADPVSQAVHFDANGIVDKVTGKLVTIDDKGNITGKGELTWTPEQSVDGVVSPAIDRMHVVKVSQDADGNNVKGVSLNHDDKSYTVTVTYADNGTTEENAQNIPASQTVHFVDEAGNELVKDNVQTSEFVRTADVVDATTGDTITEGKWNETSHVFGEVNVPVVKGYVAKVKTAGGLEATTDNPNVETTVVYYKVGKIVPVDPSGNEIPKAPTPDYPNDPEDPTSVTPDQKVPDVPGYVPSVPTITPEDPTTDTKVVYNQIQNADLVIVDQDNGSKQIVAAGVTTKFADSGIENDEIKFNGIADAINALEAKGYVYVDSTFKTGDKFDSDGETDQHFTITMKHGTEPVTPQHPGAGYEATDLQKDISRTINFVDQQGNKVADAVSQPVHFEANGTVDKVTGQLVNLDKDGNITGAGELTWTADQEVTGVESPAVDGMHVVKVSRDADGNNVKGVTLSHNDDSYTVTVSYDDNGTKDENAQTIPASQTVHFVDEAGNQLVAADVQNSTFTRTADVVDAFTGEVLTAGSWNETSHKFGQVNVPVVEGYVAEVKTAGGLEATTDEPNVEMTVVYHKVGKIVPVDPSGNPIPKAPTPDYPNDPEDPTSVTPDQKVPDVPGYVPSVPTITPENPTTDTEVVYNQIQNADLVIVDQDNGSKQIVADGVTTKFADSGIEDNEIKFNGIADAINALEAKGYVYVDSTFKTGDKFDGDGETDQHFTITMKHGSQPVNPQNPGKPGEPINPNDPEGPKYPAGSDQVTTDVTRTIEYVDNNGNQIADPIDQTAHFEGNGVLDKVTGEWITPITWTGDGDLAGAKTPVVDGYHVTGVSGDSKDNVNVDATTVEHSTDSYKVTVTYAQNGKIIPVDPSGNPIPGAPTPTYPTDPSDPAKVTPNEPVPSVPGFTPSTPTVTPQNPGVDTPVIYNPIINDQHATVTYIDDDTNKTLDIAKLTGKPGSTSDYRTADTIKNFINQGYKLVSNDYPANGVVFDDDDSVDQNFTVHFTHTTTDFNPNNPGKPGEPLNPNYPEGPKVTNDDVDYQRDVTATVHYVGAGNNNPADNVQNAQWTRTITVDNVTGEIVKSTEWLSNKDSYDAVKTPVVDGYYADQAQVDGHKVTLENQESTVTYAPNGKIVPVDPQGNPIPNAPTPQYPTDPSDPTNVTPNEPVPSIPGYTPSVPTVTPQNPGVDTPVVYTKDTVVPKPESEQSAVVNYIDQDNNNAQIATSGKLTGKLGEKIDYSTADTIKALENQGYELVTDGFPAGATYDNDDDVEQVFTVVLKHGHAPVGPNNPHTPGTPINPGEPDGPKWPSADNYQKEYSSTVHFVDNNGNKLSKDDVQTSTWGRTLIIDKVTGEITNPDENWTSDITDYDAVKVPVVDGYVADKAVVPAKKAVQENLEETVTYSKIGNIVPVDPSGNRIPGVPVKPYVNDPEDPTKVVPNESVPEIPGMTPSVTTVTPVNPTEDTPVVYTVPTPVTPQTPSEPAEPAKPAEEPAKPAPKAPATPQKEATPAPEKAAPAPAAQPAAKTLPQTGNETSDSAAALGLAALGLSGMLVAGKKRRKED